MLIILFHCLTFAAQKTENAKKYMTNVVKRMVAIIESNPISGDAFPMREFESTIKFVLRSTHRRTFILLIQGITIL